MNTARGLLTALGLLGLLIGIALSVPLFFGMNEGAFLQAWLFGLPVAGVGVLLLLVRGLLWMFASDPRAGAAKDGLSSEQRQLQDSQEFLASSRMPGKVRRK